MIAIERKKLEQVLEALQNARYRSLADKIVDPSITTVKEALAQPDYRAVKTYHEGKPVYVSQPEQEPVASLWQHGETGRTRIIMPNSITDCDARWFKVSNLYTTPPKQEHQNFCTRCGKRTNDIHTCTPPVGGHQ